MAAKKVTVAIIYDFDGTLAPGNMQEHQFLPEIGVTPEAFWEKARSLAKKHQADQILIYMHLMLTTAREARKPVRRRDFIKHGRDMTLFKGVEDWFGRITEYGKAKEVRIEHYLISSGNREIIAGSPIKSKFKKIYASKFVFNENGVAEWPALAINYTTKTQYLFRINKGTHDLSDNEAINKVVTKEDRPVPFENMIFIGDGTTDVSCFRLVKDLGGLSIAVYKPYTKGAQDAANQYRKDERVHCVAPANYAAGKKLDELVTLQIDLLASRAMLSKALK